MQSKMQNGFEYIEISNESATAKIALQGAHLFHYQQKGKKPLLWLSDIEKFTYGKAIRGGVPICWPSFGSNNPKLPQHGFARVMLWELKSIQEISKDATKVTLYLQDSEKTRKLWDYHFMLECSITIADTLEIELRTTNLDDESFELTQALHSYFNVSKIDSISITGLENKRYLDALTQQYHTQNGKIIFDQEVDRVYQGADSKIVLEDSTREVHITNSGSNSVVVWNPWIEKCSRMSVMRPDAYKGFVCIESTNAYEDKRVLQKDQTHSLRAQIKEVDND